MVVCGKANDAGSSKTCTMGPGSDVGAFEVSVSPHRITSIEDFLNNRGYRHGTTERDLPPA